MYELIIPALLAGILWYGRRRGVDLYAAFAAGVGKGLGVVQAILSPLLLMTVGISMLNSTGAVERLADLLRVPAGWLGLPAECLPLALLRPFSGAGGLSLGISVMEQYGVDSYVGKTAAVMLGAAETSFYTIGIYAAHCKGKELRRILCAALVGDLAAFVSAAFFVRLLL